MSLPWPDFLPETAGERHFAGTRVGLPEFLHAYNALGYSAEMLALEYPSVDLPVIHRFLAFYLEHTGEVDAVVAAERSALGQVRAAAPNHIALADLRQRLAARSRKASA